MKTYRELGLPSPVPSSPSHTTWTLTLASTLLALLLAASRYLWRLLERRGRVDRFRRALESAASSTPGANVVPGAAASSSPFAALDTAIACCLAFLSRCESDVDALDEVLSSSPRALSRLVPLLQRLHTECGDSGSKKRVVTRVLWVISTDEAAAAVVAAVGFDTPIDKHLGSAKMLVRAIQDLTTPFSPSPRAGNHSPSSSSSISSETGDDLGGIKWIDRCQSAFARCAGRSAPRDSKVSPRSKGSCCWRLERGASKSSSGSAPPPGVTNMYLRAAENLLRTATSRDGQSPAASQRHAVSARIKIARSPAPSTGRRPTADSTHSPYSPSRGSPARGTPRTPRSPGRTPRTPRTPGSTEVPRLVDILNATGSRRKQLLRLRRSYWTKSEVRARSDDAGTRPMSPARSPKTPSRIV